MSSSEGLRKALHQRYDRENSPNIIGQELVQPAPAAICAQGACFVAASADVARDNLPEASGPRKYLQYSSLQANLVECGNLGRYALLEAESSLSQINMLQTQANNKVKDIMQILTDPDAARKLLRPQMEGMKHATSSSSEVSNRLNSKFDAWLLYACELYSACNEMQSTDADKTKAAEFELMAKQTAFDANKTNGFDIRTALEGMAKQADAGTETFKKASDNFPAEWYIMSQHIVSAIADGTTSSVWQLYNAYMNSMNQMKMSMQGDAGKTQSALQKDTLIRGAEDPAYSSVQRNMPFLDFLNSMLTVGPNGGVDWKSAEGEGAKAGQSIRLLSTMLENAQNDFRRAATSSSPSNDLIKVYSEAAAIASELKMECEDIRMAHSPPAADSEVVKSWQSRFNTQYTKALELLATARSFPGATPLGMPLMSDGSPDPNQLAGNTEAGGAPAQALTQAIGSRYNTAKYATQDLVDTHEKSNELLNAQSHKLAAITAQLGQLCSNKIGIAEITTVLELCIKLVLSMKPTIVVLCAGYRALSSTIDAVVNGIVNPWVKDIANEDNNNIKVGDYSINDLSRSCVYESVIVIRTYNGLLGNIASVWLAISQSSIMPGMRMTDELSVAEHDNAERQRRQYSQLLQWATRAGEELRGVAKRKQEDVLSSINERLTEVQSAADRLDCLEANKKAVETGASLCKQAAQDALAYNAAAKPISRDS